jgi:hypothetical protein
MYRRNTQYADAHAHAQADVHAQADIQDMHIQTQPQALMRSYRHMPLHPPHSTHPRTPCVFNRILHQRRDGLDVKEVSTAAEANQPANPPANRAVGDDTAPTRQGIMVAAMVAAVMA